MRSCPHRCLFLRGSPADPGSLGGTNINNVAIVRPKSMKPVKNRRKKVSSPFEKRTKVRAKKVYD